MLPHFIIIGTQRGGTTSLYNYLAQHPSIIALQRREVHGYLARGVYADPLMRWCGIFPREQMLIVKSEQLYSQPHELVRQTLRFVKPEWPDNRTGGEYKRHNETSSERLRPELRARRAEFFRPHNARLCQLLGRNFQWEQTSPA